MSTIRRAPLRVFLGGIGLLLVAPPMVAAQGATSALRPIVTNSTALPLGATFSLPPNEAINDAGDYVFTAGSGTALFFRPAGATTPVRIVQAGDPAPGVPHSVADLVSGVSLNQAGLVAFQQDYHAGDATRSGIFTYDGSSITKIALATDAAPGGGGMVFGRSMSSIGLNSAGDLAFTAPLVPVGAPSGTPVNTTIYIATPGGTPVRLAGLGDAAPGTGGGTFSVLSVSGFNNLGEVLFRATISGGSGGYGVFVASQSGVRKVVATGDTNPAGGTFTFPSAAPTAFLNNAGQVAFIDNSIVFVATPASGLAVAVSLSTAVPAPLDTRSLQSIGTVSGFNDSGSILFVATLTGTSANNTAVLRYSPGNPLSMVAYKGQPVPGLTGQSFTSSFGNVRLNNAGDVSFYCTFTPNTPVFSGIFKVPAGGSLASVVLSGVSVAEGITLNLQFGGVYSLLRNDGSVYFDSYLNAPPGGATYGAYIAGSGGGLQTLVTNTDPLPSGSRTVFRYLFLAGAGNYVGILARRTGGGATAFVHNTLTGVTSKVIADGDYVGGGGRPITLSLNALNVSKTGEVVFTSGGAVFWWSPFHGLSWIAGPGEPVPGVSPPQAFSNLSLQGTFVGNVGVGSNCVLFKGTYSGGAGLFARIDRSQTVSIVRSGDTAPTGGTFTTSSFATFLVNDSCQVVFQGPTSGATGIFVVTAPGATPVKVVATGDAAPGGGTFASFPSPSPAAFNSRGEVAFYATLSGGGSGLFLGKAGSAPQAIALNANAAPSGGDWAFTPGSRDARLNDVGDVAFQAPLSGGSADSGMFLRRGATGAIETVALQGQTAPGTSYPFGSIAGTLNGIPGEMYALDPAGAILFQAPVIAGDHYIYGVWRYRMSTLEKLLMRGDAAPDGSGGTVGTLSQGPGAGRAGLFFTRIVSIDASVTDGIYSTVPPPMPGDLGGDGRPDLAVFQPSSGTWYVQGQDPVVFGAAGAVPVPADYNGDGTNELAMFRPSTNTWSIRGASDIVFGQSGDIPVPGDYDGDGTTDIAVYRPATGEWLVRNGATITLGQPGDIPVPGDYNGDGRTEPAVFRPSTGTWYIQGFDPIVYGQAGDLPVPVDVNFDGKLDIVLYRPSTGVWSAKDVGEATFGLPGDIPLTPFANNDGDLELAVYRPGNATFVTLDTDNGQQTVIPLGALGGFPVGQLPAAFLSHVPLVATVLHDAAHTAILAVKKPIHAMVHAQAVVSGPYGVPTGTVTFTSFDNLACSGAGADAGTAALDGSGVAHASSATPLSSAGLSFLAHYSGDATYSAADGCTPVAAMASGGSDFDADQRSDILWRHATRGEVWLWPMDGTTASAQTYVRTVGDTNWEIRGIADFDGNGKADILWRNKITGQIYLWPMDGSTVLSETYVATVDTAYDIVGTGDYDGDGKADILWRHMANGQVWIWLMNGATPLSQVHVDTVDPMYAIVASGDLNADGKADIVWQHTTTGAVWVWLMNGTSRTSQTYVATVADLGYQIVGVADFDGNGKADILWHHATNGQVWIWPMDGSTLVSQSYVDTVPDTGYQIVGTGDYDGDGKADVLWHHATLGQVWVWLMDGTTRLSQTWVATVPDTGYGILKVK